ncbi:MAG: 4Fe-4S dicluster domain-containing protein, partial [Dehalococcoidales bacterium]|nr:4Fe-4S dicluster domain-containing protein [Dehalococcoidales bacterium]
MIHTALLRLQGLATSFPRLRPVLPTALVVGAGDAAVECAGNLAAQGFKTVLISSRAVSDATRETIEHAGVEIIEKAEIKAIAGAVGSFEVTVARSGKSKSLLAGVIILDGGALLLEQLATIQNLLGLPDDAAWLRPSADSGIDAPETLVRGVYFCQAGETPDHATTWGLAAAARASALLASRHIRLASNVARVESFRCRGCGDCEKVCGYYAIRVEIAETGTGTAAVDDVLCRGCGNCAAHCRSGAIVME